MEIFERFKEERERLGMSQTVFAEKLGSTKRSVINWESGASSPNAEIIARLTQIGVDVMYLLTGARGTPTESTLNKREQALLDNYRHSPDEGQRAIEATASALSQSTKASSKKRA